MFIPVSKNKQMLFNRVRTVGIKSTGSGLLLNQVKTVHMGVVKGNGVVDYGGLVGIPRIRHLQLPEAVYKPVQQEIKSKAGLLNGVKELKDPSKMKMVQDLKSLKVSGSKRIKKGINNLRFEL